MSTYREIHGKAIKTVAANPTDDTAEGQIWFNSTDDTFKSIVGVEAFTSSSPLSTGRFSSAGAGSQTASLIAGGYSTAATNITEEYNGSGWAAGGNLNTARYYIGGAGTQTSALAMSGRNPPVGWALTNTEKYDGSAWTNSTASPTALNQVTTTGTQTAGLLWGGVPSPGAAHVSTTYEFDGSSWASGGALPAGLKVAGAFGTQTAAMSAGNETGSTLYYDGSSWSDQSATVPYSGADYWNYGGTSGTQTAGILMGGGPGAVTTTAKWDGSTWSSSPAMATARLTGPMGPIGTSTAGLIASGAAPGPVYTTQAEEFNSSINVITAAAWSSGGTVPQIVRGGSSGGTQTAAWLTGGLQYPGDTKNKTWTYDGSSWSSAEDLPNNYFIGGGVGPATAGLAWDGIGSYGPGTATYEWDGSNWTAGGALPAIGPGGCQGDTGAGVGQTAAVALGGTGDPPPAQSSRMIAYDGSSWSSDEAMPTGVSGCAADGPNTAIWIAGGYSSPDSTSSASREYDGSNWTDTGNLIQACPQGVQFQGWGPQTNAILAGGSSSHPTSTFCQQYNGTIWVSAPSLSTARDNHAYCSKTAGTQTGFIAGGYSNTGNTGATEEFNAETTAVNVKTLTQS